MSDADEHVELVEAQEMSISFPNWFPSSCPPETAVDASNEVYRIVKDKPLVDSDFLSHHELGTALTAPPCVRCGLSVFDSLNTAMHRQKLSPYLGEYIAKAGLIPSHGKTSGHQGKSGHLTWWPYAVVVRKACFEEPVKCL